MALIFLGKTAVFPSILAQTHKSSITVNDFGKLKYDESFIDLGPKLTLVVLLSRYPPKMAKIWHEPQHRQRPVSRKQNFVRGGSNWKVIAPGVLVICTLDKNCGSTKKAILAPNIKIVHFRPQRPIGALLVNVFNTKEVFYWFPDMRALLVPRWLAGC